MKILVRRQSAVTMLSLVVAGVLIGVAFSWIVEMTWNLIHIWTS